MRRLSGVRARLGRVQSWLSSVVAGETEPGPGDGGPRSELEEEVYFILRQRGGWAHRRTVLEEARWQAGTIDDCLTRMRTEGRVEQGRRNGEDVIALPGRAPPDPDAR